MGFVAWRGQKEFKPTPGFGFVYHSDYPERYVRDRSERGWQVCESCSNQFKLWMTSYQNWEKLPKSFREFFLCTPCFRKLATGGRT